MKIRENDLMSSKKDQKKVDKGTVVSRRQFLKKTAYTAPSLVILSSLTRPTVAFGGSDTNTGPGGGFGGGNGFGGG